MKKFASVMLCLLFLLTNMEGQDEDLRIGFQLSPNFSWMSVNDNMINRTGTNLGITMGAIGELFFEESYAFTFGLNLTFNQGGTIKHDTGGNFFSRSDLSDDTYNSGKKPLPDGVKLKYSLQYLEVPIGFKLRTREFGYLRYFLEAPILTWGLSTQARGTIETGDIILEKENINKDVFFFSASWGFGLGVEYSLDNENILLGGIYFKKGFTDITNNEATTATFNPDNSPTDPNDDYRISKEDSKGSVNALTFRLAILF
jgi:hypothetical protein